MDAKKKERERGRGERGGEGEVIQLCVCGGISEKVLCIEWFAAVLIFWHLCARASTQKTYSVCGDQCVVLCSHVFYIWVH